MNLIKTSLVVVAMSCSLTAQAANSMKDVFDGYTTGHGAVSYETKSHSVMNGGSFSYRAKFYDYPDLVQFQGPSISAGCNGIDIQVGSFSMIKDLAGTLQNSMRQIAAGAASYAFNLALDALCPTCAANIKALQEKMEKWNQFFRDSCEAGENLVDRAANGLGYERYQAHTAIKQQASSGQKDSWADAISALPDMTLAELVKNTTGSTAVLTGNIYYEAIRSSNLSDTTYSFANFDQYVLSMVGSIVVTTATPGTDKMGNATSDIATKPYGSIFNITDYLFGDADTEINLYQCDDQNKSLKDRECLTMAAEPSMITPMNQFFIKVLSGEYDNSNRSVFQIYRSGGRGTNAFSDSQKDLVSAKAFALYPMIEKLATMYVDDSSVQPYYDAIAAMYAYHYGTQFITKSHQYLQLIQDSAQAVSNAKTSEWAQSALKEIQRQSQQLDAAFKNTRAAERIEKLVDLAN